MKLDKPKGHIAYCITHTIRIEGRISASLTCVVEKSSPTCISEVCTKVTRTSCLITIRVGVAVGGIATGRVTVLAVITRLRVTLQQRRELTAMMIEKLPRPYDGLL